MTTPYVARPDHRHKRNKLQNWDLENLFPLEHSVYDECIERASEDQIRTWLYSLGFTPEELDHHEYTLCESIRDLAQEQIELGYPFDFVI